MFRPDFNNKYFRVYAVTTDKLGVDPFLDMVVPRIQEITKYTNHNVTQEERGAADLISLREYGEDHYWWHIMAYNGLCTYRDIVEGMTVKIPDLGAIIAITNDVMAENRSTTERIAYI